MRVEQIDVLELLIECIRGSEERLGDLVQALENVAYVRNIADIRRHPSSW